MVNLYLDASNFLIELKKFTEESVRIDEPDTDLTFHMYHFFEVILNNEASLSSARSFWFGSHKCSTEEALKYRLVIRKAGFEPILLKRAKGKGEKGVDIAMATEMMANAFNNKCSVSVIITGDEDYAPVVRELRRANHKVIMMFFGKSSSDILRVECDNFIDFDKYEDQVWSCLNLTMKDDNSSQPNEKQ